LKLYEKLSQIVDDSEKNNVKLKLLELYKKLGKIREYTVLSGQLKMF
jgi:hypothetical protein